MKSQNFSSNSYIRLFFHFRFKRQMIQFPCLHFKESNNKHGLPEPIRLTWCSEHRHGVHCRGHSEVNYLKETQCFIFPLVLTFLNNVCFLSRKVACIILSVELARGEFHKSLLMKWNCVKTEI